MLTIDDLLKVLEQVTSFDAGEPYNIECYGNQFLLRKEDIEMLLEYIKELKGE